MKKRTGKPVIVKDDEGNIVDMIPVSNRERTFIARVAAGSSITAAARDVGVSPSQGRNYMKNPGVLALYEQALQAAGITDDAIAAVLKGAMGAMRRVQIPQGDGTMAQEFDVDHNTRLAAVKQVTDIAAKAAVLRGDTTNDILDALPDNVDSMSTLELTRLVMTKVKIS